MCVTKLKTIAIVALLLAVVLVGGGWLAYAALQPDEHKQPVWDAQKAPLPESKKSEKPPAWAGAELAPMPTATPLPPKPWARLGTVRFRQGPGPFPCLHRRR